MGPHAKIWCTTSELCCSFAWSDQWASSRCFSTSVGSFTASISCTLSSSLLILFSFGTNSWFFMSWVQFCTAGPKCVSRWRKPSLPPPKWVRLNPRIVSLTKLTRRSLRFLCDLRPWRSRVVHRYLARLYAQKARDGREEEGLEEEEKVSPILASYRTPDLMFTVHSLSIGGAYSWIIWFIYCFSLFCSFDHCPFWFTDCYLLINWIFCAWLLDWWRLFVWRSAVFVIIFTFKPRSD